MEPLGTAQHFAATLGQLSLPPQDEADAHKVIRDAITIATDLGNTTYSPPMPATTQVCPPYVPRGLAYCNPDVPATAEALNYPSTWQADTAVLNQDFRVLLADLGGS